mmetsp:Transcript_75366/g.145747  ORF Transcript_75366/g.145747 Transcript_75366/m.145747 type:complete len:80 (-) Transcript_75366:29-268(-)
MPEAFVLDTSKRRTDFMSPKTKEASRCLGPSRLDAATVQEIQESSARKASKLSGPSKDAEVLASVTHATGNPAELRGTA